MAKRVLVNAAKAASANARPTWASRYSKLHPGEYKQIFEVVDGIDSGKLPMRNDMQIMYLCQENLEHFPPISEMTFRRWLRGYRREKTKTD